MKDKSKKKKEAKMKKEQEESKQEQYDEEDMEKKAKVVFFSQSLGLYEVTDELAQLFCCRRGSK